VSATVTPSPGLPLRTQLTRFVVTGGFSSVVDFGLYLSMLGLGLTVVPAKALGFVAGTTTAYAINRRWTFGSVSRSRTALPVFGLYAITFVVQVGLNTILAGILPPEWWRTGMAFVLAQGTATTINFLVQRMLIFRP